MNRKDSYNDYSKTNNNNPPKYNRPYQNQQSHRQSFEYQRDRQNSDVDRNDFVRPRKSFDY